MRRGRIAALLVLAAALCAPASASASIWVVNSTGDTPDESLSDGVCSDFQGQCTLRAALAESGSGSAGDTIYFGAPFDGGPGAEIQIESPLDIPYETTIAGGDCGAGGFFEPCVWVGYETPSSTPVFNPSFNVQVRGLALGNASAGFQGAASNSLFFANWIGLHLDGSPAPVGSGFDLRDSNGTQIGSSDTRFGNRIAASRFGVSLTGVSSGVKVVGNAIGVDPVTGAATLRPGVAGVLVTAGYGFPAATVESNQIAASGGAGVLASPGVGITDNYIGVSKSGARIGGGDTGVAFLQGFANGPVTVTGNVIGNVSGPGLVIVNSYQTVSGNWIGQDKAGRPEPNGGPGIRITGNPAPFYVGIAFSMYTPLPANRISYNAGPAIEVLGASANLVLIGQNYGVGNGGPFIDLGGDGPGNILGLNGGISAPRILGASTTAARGLAQPDVAVYVYASASGAQGDLTAPLGIVQSSATGRWSLPYAALPPTASIAADQISIGSLRGTSELSMRPIDSTPPRTKIKISSRGKGKVLVKLTASEPGSTLSCAVDKKPLKDCAAVLFLDLKKGRHKIKALATDGSGNREVRVVKRAFRVR